MIDLRPADHDALKRAVAAGAAGLPLSAVPVSTAIILALEDLVVITRPPAQQRVIATEKGAAHSRRGAFA